MWCAICALIFLFALRNVYIRYQDRCRKVKLLASNAEQKPKGRGAAAAISASFRNGFLATAFPSWLYGPETVADACWTMAYFLASIAVTLWNGPWNMGQQQISNQFGDVAFAQAPLMMFFVMKNNPISLLTGIPYVRFNYLHRASARTMFVWSWLHTGLSFKTIEQRKLWKDGYIIWGWVGLGAYQFLWMFSYAIVRRRLHQFFFTSHIVLTIFLSTPRLSLGPVEAHPFTIANIPNAAGEVVLLPRVYGGWTSQIYNHVTSTSTKAVRCYFDGPYGIVHDFTSFQHVLMVAGGTGVSPWTSQLLALVQAGRNQPTRTYVRLVWLIKQAEIIEWISPILDEVAAGLAAPGCNVHVSVDVYVTRGALPMSRTSSNEEKKPESLPGTPGELDGVPVLDSKLARDEQSLLSSRASDLVSWHSGRPDLAKVIRDEAEATTEEMALGVCGPRGLVLTTNVALKEASNYASVSKGQAPIHYFPETLGQ
ncbi:hypothetical protein MNV49_004081 [Pseudohyphozyma bogoriensis]|nr:hypothetical protein MNV49_004081 [Pseudohyphozyma bogoriensis]